MKIVNVFFSVGMFNIYMCKDIGKIILSLT